MPRKRTSKIWNLPLEDFIHLCGKSSTMKEALAFFGLKNKGGNYRTFIARVRENDIDISHFLSRTSSSACGRTIPLENILIKGSSYKNSTLKKRLFQNGLLKNQCYLCGLKDRWNGRDIVLQLDHINGISDDNRLENLRILCPNCHSQTKTFAGRNN